MNTVNRTVPKKMKPSQVREYYGFSNYFLKKAIKEGKLSYTKIGNCFMLDTDELEKLIESNTYQNNR